MPKPGEKTSKKAKVATGTGKRRRVRARKARANRAPPTAPGAPALSVGIAPSKNTAGGGFLFENRVCAAFLAQMLAGEPSLDPALGVLERIDFQTKVQGWHLDDVLLTLADGVTRRKCALSVKSNRQFAGAAAPSDFVTAAWEQFLHVGTSQFDASMDLLGLVTAPLEPELRSALDGLVAKAVAGDPLLLPANLDKKKWANDHERSLFRSFACPSPLASSHAPADGDVVRLLSRMRFLEYDFEAVVSRSAGLALRHCRGALRSGDIAEAGQLWLALQAVADELRPQAGFITRNGILDRLRTRFDLNDRPDHRPDWERLLAHSRQAAAQITDAIGGSVRVNRDVDRAALENALTGPVEGLVILGPSGSGKSAILRSWCEHRLSEGRKTLWFDGRSFDRPDFAAFEASLRLKHNLSELVQSVGDKDAILALDGLDRLYGVEAFRILGSLIRALELGRPAGPWRVVMTCQTPEWPRLQDQLLQAGVGLAWEIRELTPITPAALTDARTAFPAAAGLFRQQKLRPLLRNLKIVDMVARRSGMGETIENTGWVGESSVATWFWESEVSRGPNGPMRDRFARLLAERQADALREGLSPDEFGVSDLQPLGELKIDKVCKTAADGRVAFEHDLYADWARLRILVSASDVADYLRERLESPLWHRAIRLYGLSLLEGQGDLSAWRAALGVFGEKNNVFRDLLLEAPIFAADPAPLLEEILPDLLQHKGRLLRRFLNRFLVYATLPDPQMLALAKAQKFDEARTRAHYRYPNWPLWAPVLRFLHAHRSELLDAAPEEIARIVELWLRHMPADPGSLRREAAELALSLAERALAARRDYGRDDYRDREIYYRIALSAANDLPDRVTSFALQASERQQTVTADSSSPTDPEAISILIKMDPRFDPNERKPDPWPDGPRGRVDEDFRKVVLDQYAILLLAKKLPAVAREVVLAVLIEPRKRFEWHEQRYGRRALEIHDGTRWHPVLYTDGPFLLFLHIDFTEGLELIVRLVDFATERWKFYVDQGAAEAADAAQRGEVAGIPGFDRWTRPATTLRLTVEGTEQELLGDDRVYGWSGALGNPPTAVTAALMALEQFLYQELDAKRPIDDKLQAILRRTRSVAVLGVLCELGKKEPTLFEGPLRCLLSLPEIYLWNINVASHGRGHLMMGYRSDPGFVANAQTFHRHEHRKVDLRRLVPLVLLNRANMRDFFASVVAELRRRLEAPSDPVSHDFLEQMVATLDINAYEVRGSHIVNGRLQQAYDEQAPERQAFEERWLVRGLPLRCRKAIDEDTPIPDTGPALLFEQLNRVYALGEKAEAVPAAQGGGAEVWNAVAGGVAVLLRFHREWVMEDPARYRWCVERLEEIVRKPPGGSLLDSPDSVSDWTWDCFAADVIPLLWAAEPTDEKWRELVVRILFGPHNIAVKILFARCAEQRAELGREFDRLHSLLFEWAFARDRVAFVQRVAPSPGTFGLTDQDVHRCAEEAKRWLTEHGTSFVAGRTPPATARWADADTSARWGETDRISAKWYSEPRMSFDLIQAAHQWMPALAQARSLEERRKWVTFWKEALEFILGRAGALVERDNRTYPDDHERWVLSRTGEMLLEMNEKERPGEILDAVFALPEDAHHWPDIFLHAFHRAALSLEVLPAAYVPMVGTIVTKVARKPTGRWPFHEDVWDSVVGLDGYTQRYWEVRHTSLVVELADVFEQWFEAVPAYARRVASVARWLAQPATRPIRIRAIQWLDRKVKNAPRSMLKRDEPAADALAALLNGIWQQDEEELRRVPESFTAFRTLLRALADEQNQLALDLLGRLGGLG